MRGSAMSGAPTCIGTIQLASPTKAGMTAPKIITSACMVVMALKSAGSRNCKPGLNSSARISIANRAADEEHDAAEHQVQRADVLVVGRREPALPEAVRLVVVVIVVRRARRVRCGPCRYLAGMILLIIRGPPPRYGRCPASLPARSAPAPWPCRGRQRLARGRRAAAAASPAWRPCSHFSKSALAAHLDHDGHEAVVAAAQLGALAAVGAGLVRVDLEPGLVDEARDRILLDGERRHPPGMDDILRR